jgi:hypothetical protein
VKKPKTPNPPADADAGAGDLAGTDMTATFADAASITAAAVPPAVAELREHLQGDQSQQAGWLLSGRTGRGKTDPAMMVALAHSHSPAPLIREQDAWDYPGNVPSQRPLQVWRTGPDSVLAIVSDRPTDQGTSTTNAAEQIVAKLQAEYPGQQVEVIERMVQPAVFGGGEDYHRVEIGQNGSATWTPVPRADLAARLGEEFTTTSTAGDVHASTPPSTPPPLPSPKAPKAPKVEPAAAAGAPRMSSEPLRSNGWGGFGGDGQVYFHDDGAIGTAIKSMGADAHLQVAGGALANVLGQIATEGVSGRISAQEILDSVKRVRDEVPAGSSARRALDGAVRKMDAPQSPLPPIPDTAPEPLRQLVHDLHAIPLVRKDTSQELDPLVQVLHDHATGKIGQFRLQFAVRDLRNRRHESYEGKFAIDAAIEAALDALQTGQQG